MWVTDAIAARMSAIGLAGDAIARTSKPPPNATVSFPALVKAFDVVAPTTSVNTTSVNMARIVPVRKRSRSG